MISLIDRTIGELGQESSALLRELLLSAGADAVEEHDKPRFEEFRVNDIREARTMALAAESCRLNGGVRIRGLDDILLGNRQSLFSELHRHFAGRLEFAPGDGCGLATAAAVEWALMFAADCRIVVTFGGIGGYAAYEEVAVALKLARLRKVGKNYPEFPRIRAEIERITGESFPRNKPVTGSDVFRVKSETHIDGILKQPKTYMPFPPEIVGRETEIVLSKQSGKSAAAYKLEQMGRSADDKQINKILALVKRLSVLRNGNVTDSEFEEIVRKVCGDET